METAKLFDQLVAGTHMKMIRIGQLHLRTDFFQVHSGNGALDCAHCPHIHKNGGLDRAVNRFQFSAFGTSFRPQYLIFCHLFFSLLNE